MSQSDDPNPFRGTHRIYIYMLTLENIQNLYTEFYIFLRFPLGKPQKKVLLDANQNFFYLFSSVPKFQRPLSSRGGGGGLGLNGPAIKRRNFVLRLPLHMCVIGI